MAESWRPRDEEMFSGIPQNGRCAPGRDDDLAGIFSDCIHKGFEERAWEERRYHNYIWENTDEEGPPTDYAMYTPTGAKELPRKIARRLDEAIDAKMCEGDGLFYIGRLPPVKRIKIGTYTSPDSRSERAIHFGYFNDRDVEIPHLTDAENSVSILRNYLRTPFSELLHILLRLLLAAVSIVQLVLAVNENIEYSGFLMVSGLPLFYPDTGTGFLFWHGVAWFAVGLLVCIAAYFLEVAFANPLGELGPMLLVGHFIVAAAHGVSALRMILVSASVSALMIVFELIFLLVYAVAIVVLIPRVFRAMRRKKHIPEDYAPDFLLNAAYCYWYCRLRILWYENATGKAAPSEFRSAIRKLEKLDRQYNKLMRTFERITGRTV